MSVVNDGGAAFPRAYSNNHLGEHVWEQDGMTLRDYFAAKALHAVMVGEQWKHRATAEDMTVTAYAVADAMLAARTATPRPDEGKTEPQA
jgi:hypothetical protein